MTQVERRVRSGR